jgi:hypothetical protein
MSDLPVTAGAVTTLAGVVETPLKVGDRPPIYGSASRVSRCAGLRWRVAGVGAFNLYRAVKGRRSFVAKARARLFISAFCAGESRFQ